MKNKSDDSGAALERENAELRRQLDASAAELRDTQEHFRLVGEAVAEGIYDWNIAQNRLWVSPRLIALFGWETGSSGPGNRPSQDWAARVHPDDIEGYRAALRGVLKRETPRMRCEYRIRVSSGDYRWVEDHAVPAFGEDSRATRLAGAVSDITERKEIERALHELNRLKDESLADLNAVIDTIDYGVLFMGPDLRGRVINRAFRDMWGVPDSFIATGPTMADLINYNRHNDLYDVPEAEFDAFIARRVEAIQAGNIAPVEMRRADGRILRYTGVVLPDGGRMLTYLDITDAKRRESELSETLDQQTATAEVLQVINSSPGDLAPVFEAMLDKALQLCDANYGYLLTYDGEGLVPVADRGNPAFSAWIRERGKIVPEPGTINARIIAGEAVVQVADVVNDPFYQADTAMRRAVLEIGGFRTVLTVALRRDAALLGVIHIYRQEVRPFSDRQIALLQNFAAQAVIAMENARLITETREALEQQTATAEVLQVINFSPGDPTPVFDTILEKAHRLCGASRGTLFLFDGEFFRAAVMHGYPEGRPPPVINISDDPRLALLAAGERLVHIPDLTKVDDPIARTVAERGGVRTNLLLPLRKDGALLGVISCNRPEVRPFSGKDIALLENFAAQAVIAMENARLITETREALEQQTATAEVLQVINSSPGDLSPVFDAMLEKAVRLCEAAYGVLFVVEGDRIRDVAERNVPKPLSDYLAESPPQIGRDTMLGRALLDRKILHTADPTAEASYREGVPLAVKTVELGGARAFLMAPLTTDEAVLGIFALFRTEARAFTDKQVALAQNFAAQAVIAMENARLINETREALEQQTATAEVLQAINASPGDLAPVFDAMLEKAMRLCEAAFGQLTTYDGERFHTGATRGVPIAFAEFRQRNPPDYGPGTAPARVLGGEPLVHIADLMAEDAYRDGEPNRRALVDLGGARSSLVVPLAKERRVLGFINIYRQEVRPFSEKQIALAQNFAQQAVIAMENARLITETREALEQQTATAEVLQVINSSPGDLTPVFEAMVEKARRLCNADSGHLALPADHDFRTAVVSAMSSEMEAVIRAVSYGPGRGTAVGRALMERQAVQIADIATDPEHAARHAGNMGLIRTILGVPLLRDGEAIGAFGLSRSRVEPFTERQVELVRTFAAQAVIAMENARLLGELRQRTEEVAELNRGLEARVAEQVDELGRVGRLKRFLAPQLAELIVSHGDEKILESHRREIVVVFCDLRGYTAFTETAEPEEVLDFLREYHGALGPLVSQFEGTLDQFSGDGIMVFFNDPVPIPDPAERAVKMAMAMREAAGALTAVWRRRGRELGFGAGIAQGYATLGQIGFSERSGYTAIGTVCNVAARLCAEAKDGQILIAQRVAAGLDGDIALEEIGPLPLKGITQPVVAFNVAAVASGAGRLRLVEP